MNSIYGLRTHMYSAELFPSVQLLYQFECEKENKE